MNTFSNFSSVNGWMLPGSGSWASQGTEDFYVDDNGDLWVPCFCDEEDGEGRAAGLEEPEGAVEEASEAQEPIEEPEAPAPAQPAEEQGVIRVDRPACILYYPGRSLMGHAMGMLADGDKGGCWTYRGVHSGTVRLRITHANMTSRAAVRDPRAPGRVVLTSDDIYPGLALRYAVVFENRMDMPAAVTVRGQAPFNVAFGTREWLYLGHGGFVREEGWQAHIEPGRMFEAALDLELTEELTIRCCAYHDKSKIDFSGRVWSPPREGDVSDPDRALFMPPPGHRRTVDAAGA